jgi:hypothetical protein
MKHINVAKLVLSIAVCAASLSAHANLAGDFTKFMRQSMALNTPEFIRLDVPRSVQKVTKKFISLVKPDQWKYIDGTVTLRLPDLKPSAVRGSSPVVISIRQNLEMDREAGQQLGVIVAVPKRQVDSQMRMARVKNQHPQALGGGILQDEAALNDVFKEFVAAQVEAGGKYNIRSLDEASDVFSSSKELRAPMVIKMKNPAGEFVDVNLYTIVVEATDDIDDVVRFIDDLQNFRL